MLNDLLHRSSRLKRRRSCLQRSGVSSSKSLLEALLDEVKSYVHRIRNAAAALGVVDTLVSLSKVALESNYCRPEVHTGLDIEIIDGRHPVVETMEIEGGLSQTTQRSDLTATRS